MLLAVICYVAISYYVYLVVAQRYRRVSNFYDFIKDGEYQDKIIRLKMTVRMIIGIALIFVLYNMMVTLMRSGTGGDRSNYALNFYGYRNSPSEGLTFVINLVKIFTNDVRWFYYVCMFIPVVVTLFAYSINREALPVSILFLLSTQYVLFMLAGLKQAYANAFAVLCIAFALRNNGKKDLVFCIISMILAIWFHHTGYFLLPIIVMLKIRKTSKRNVLFMVLMVLAIVFLEPILIRVASMVRPVFPFLARKIYEYFGESAIEGLQTEGRSTFIKGVPFYVLTLVGWIKRKQLVNVIDNYDNYLFLSFMLSLVYLSTLYNSWMYRLAYFLYFPAGIYYGQLMTHINLKSNKKILEAVILGFTALFTLRFLALMYINYGGF